METKTYTTIDRAALGWPAGPWDGEPDKVQWPDAATGLPWRVPSNEGLGVVRGRHCQCVTSEPSSTTALAERRCPIKNRVLYEGRLMKKT